MTPREMIEFLRYEAREWRKMAASVSAEPQTPISGQEVLLAFEKAKQFDLIADYCERTAVKADSGPCGRLEG